MLWPLYLWEKNFWYSKDRILGGPQFLSGSKGAKRNLSQTGNKFISPVSQPRDLIGVLKGNVFRDVYFCVLIGVYHCSRITTHHHHNAIYLHGDRRVNLKCHLFIAMSELPRLYHNTVRTRTRITYLLIDIYRRWCNWERVWQTGVLKSEW